MRDLQKHAPGQREQEPKCIQGARQGLDQFAIASEKPARYNRTQKVFGIDESRRGKTQCRCR